MYGKQQNAKSPGSAGSAFCGLPFAVFFLEGSALTRCHPCLLLQPPSQRRPRHRPGHPDHLPRWESWGHLCRLDPSFWMAAAQRRENH